MPSATGSPPVEPQANSDLRFLQDPNIYHPLPTTDVAPAFLHSKLQPPPGSPLTDLLSGGHFRRAAERAVHELVRCSPDEVERIFQLFYTRLICLMLISRPDIAAQEAVPLLELLARNSPNAITLLPRVPWELRILLVRLQSIGTSDGGRRSIMGLYALATECRDNIRETNVDDVESQAWGQRLSDLGLRVSDALVEMGELETANRHLDTLADVDEDEIAYRKALLRVRVGDISGAQACVKNCKNRHKQGNLQAQLKMANGDFSGARADWQSKQDSESDPLSANNLAVALLYTGHIIPAQDILEGLANSHPGFPALLFNLSTAYELCTERATDRKTSLVEKMASKTPAPDSGGWEKATFEFKL